MSVSVLTLNGRRQTVKCTPNITILQVKFLLETIKYS